MLRNKYKALQITSLVLCLSLLFINLSFARDITLIPVSIRNGLESHVSLDWPLKDKQAVFRSSYFKEQQALALKAELDLKQHMERAAIGKFSKKKGNFYALFGNLVEASLCKRGFLIQRVKLLKSYFNEDGHLYKTNNKYLVEAFKIKKQRNRVDLHYRSYSLNDADRRVIKVEVEVGCGEIVGVAEGKRWPFPRNTLYNLIQDYSSSKGLYDDVSFDFSRKYSFSVDFESEGIRSLSWPDFIDY